MYFWQDDPLRAFQWAQAWRPKAPSLVGAAIELGNCLDLTTQRGISAVFDAYESYRQLQQTSGESLPVNVDPKGSGSGDRVLRFLDRAVIDHLHGRYSEITGEDFGTVRALFPEGEELYPGAGFLRKTHIQIAVRKQNQVLGIFRVPDWQRMQFGIPDCYGNF
jgi:hypothetical protein